MSQIVPHKLQLIVKHAFHESSSNVSMKKNCILLFLRYSKNSSQYVSQISNCRLESFTIWGQRYLRVYNGTKQLTFLLFISGRWSLCQWKSYFPTRKIKTYLSTHEKNIIVSSKYGKLRPKQWNRKLHPRWLEKIWTSCWSKHLGMGTVRTWQDKETEIYDTKWK